MRGRIRTRKPAFEEEHKFRPTPRGTNVYVRSKISRFNPLDEPLNRIKEEKLITEMLTGKEIGILEVSSLLRNTKTRNLMILFMDRLDSFTLGYIARKDSYPLPARLKAVELLSDNFDAICAVKNGLDYEPRSDDKLKVRELVYEKWEMLMAQRFKQF